MTSTASGRSSGAARPALADVVAWDGDRLVVACQDSLNRLNRPYLSPSTSKAMSGCAARWAAERLMPRHEDPFSPGAIGDSVHKVLEDLYGLPGYARTRTRSLLILEAHRDQKWPGTDDLTRAKRVQWHTSVHNGFSGLWDIENPQTVQVVDREVGFDESTSVCDIPFVGYIDRTSIVAADDGTGLSIDDYKSGSVPKNITRFGDDHGDQLRLYYEALRTSRGARATQARLLYTAHGKDRIVPLSNSAMSKTLTGFRNSWRDLNSYCSSAAFPTQESPLCGWCPLVNSCPVARAAGRTDRLGSAPQEVTLAIPVLRALDVTQIPAPAPDVDEPRGETGRDFGSASVHDFQLAAPPQNEPQNRQEAHTMSEQNFPLAEDKSWFEHVHGALNGNSYAAGAVFGMSSLAYDLLAEAHLPIGRQTHAALAATLFHIVNTVESELSANPSLMNGLNTRLRGVLRSVIQANPLPFGQGDGEWDQWVDRALSHTRSIARQAIALHHDPAPVRPWMALAVRQVHTG